MQDFFSIIGTGREIPASAFQDLKELGSVIIYNGAIWHGHSNNSSDLPRRSIQGAYIRRDAHSGINLPGRMKPDTLARIGSLARYILAV